MRIYEDMAYGPEPVADSYWSTTVERAEYYPLVESTECDTAIIGAGYTGVNAALELVRAGQDVVVLDANFPGWGASGRNGGFCCIGGSKTDLAALSHRVGRGAALEYFRSERDAVGFVADRLETLGIDADTHSDGETQLAHAPAAAAEMQEHLHQFETLHGVRAEFLPREALAENGFGSDAFFGALTAPIGFALNPMKYINGLARAAVDEGVRVFGHSAVCATKNDNTGAHVLVTQKGEVRARNLVVATNGYSSEDIPHWLGGRYLPVQSGIIATRPMSDDEIYSQGWTSRQMCYDSRNLLHYFRLLPDNRMLFGRRAGSNTTPRSEANAHARARADFDLMFPAWRDVETEHYWSGLVCMARNRTPFAGSIPGLDRAWAALCYHGNGVAMGSFAGALVAAQILGQGQPTPAVMSEPLRKFELGRSRRMIMPFVSAWYGLKDRRAR